ncbi:MAG: transporter substrate-binding domain-containing protein [Caldilinea sp.]|nr:transporter substrate-binding domain-containing protein [Caldilinea sp.]MDW8439285.1 transporter substrate-binding domain-containing protein [Caldilineaceae bacterium]
MKSRTMHLSLWMLILLALSACQMPVAAPTAATPVGEEAPAADLLSIVQQRGKLIVSTDPAYPPQSELVAGVAPPADTKCTGDERPANQFSGFDIDVAVAIAEKLGVEACFVTPDWTLITAGGWAGRWDLSIGSMTITPERMRNLYFTQPYYTTPAAFFVHQDNTTFTQPSDLSGKRIGVCTGCTYESYLDGTLSIPGETIEFVVSDAQIVGYDTDVPALEDLALGDGVRLDAVLTAQPTGLTYIANGGPLKQLGEPVYFEYLAGAIDKSAPQDTTAFRDAVTKAIQELHAEGVLLALSEQYYGVDLTSAAAEFDLAGLEQ